VDSAVLKILNVWTMSTRIHCCCRQEGEVSDHQRQAGDLRTNHYPSLTECVASGALCKREALIPYAAPLYTYVKLTWSQHPKTSGGLDLRLVIRRVPLLMHQCTNALTHKGLSPWALRSESRSIHRLFKVGYRATRLVTSFQLNVPI